MRYVDYGYFSSIYGGDISETEFNRLGYEAERVTDMHTTGIDNVKKLRAAFPVNEDDAEAVKRCVCKLIKTLADIEAAENAGGYVSRADGTVAPREVSSVSSGSESISYATGSGKSSAVSEAAGEPEKRKGLLAGIVREYLSGVTDLNGVNLLYMGSYPICTQTQ